MRDPRSRGRGRTLLLAALLALHAPFVSAQTPTTPTSLPMQGKTVLITGSTDGLGREVATRVAALGAHVIVHGRNAERGKAVVDEITAAGKGSARFHAADFASIAGVRAFAAEVKRDHPRIHVLINNAGVLVPRGEARRTSADGHELHFAVNYLAGWVLTHELRPNLERAAPSRVISVASMSQSPIDFDDVMLERPGAAARGYGQSKFAQILMTVELAPEFSARGVTLVALHPATLMNTNMVTAGGMAARSTVNQGADAVMQLVTLAELPAGAYYNGLRVATPHAQAADAEARARLRALSRTLTGVP